MSWIEETPLLGRAVDVEHRFGGTVVEVTAGHLSEQPVRALIVPANQRGAMGLGRPGSVRALAGERVEREAMSRAPLPLGTVLRTGSGNLSERGIEAILHAVVSPAPGHPALLDAVRRATVAAFEAAETARLRSLALPVLGSGTGDGHLPLGMVASEIVEVLVAFLRRNQSRIERVVVVTSFDDDQAVVNRLVQLAYVHRWARSE